jgi:hypothetical protein
VGGPPAAIPGPRFNEPAARELVRRDIERARADPAVQNHDSIHDDGGDYPPVSSIAVPTHGVHRADWERIVAAILEHT